MPEPTSTLSPELIARAMISNPGWAQRLGWGVHQAAIAILIDSPNAQAGDAAFAQGIARWQARKGLSVDGIVGRDSWKVLKAALAEPAAPTSVVPAGQPAVPNGFDQVIAAYGDPRPLISAAGTITPENESLWQRQTLSKGQLPFPIPLNPSRPDAGMKTSFYAHRRLVSTFEAVFQEIDRLGLREHIHSWGGIYNFRPIRGVQSRLSLHCFGAALDLNSESNQLGAAGDMNPRIVEVFEHFGFLWGGNFRGRPDPMHFQYATGY